MDILPIPASAVPCERIFSSAKETTTARRNRISSDLMEALQMLKFSIQHGNKLSFTDGLDWDDEIKELEFTAISQIEYVQDVKSYSQNLAKQFLS